MWRVAAARETGTSHLRSGKPCQDALAVARDEDCLFLFGADGAGSAARAEVGSRLAVEAALEAARAELAQGAPDDEQGWEKLLERILHVARQRLEQEAQDAPPLRDLSTTLLGVIWTPGHLAAVQIGDGWIISEQSSGGMAALISPTRGEYVNETVFLTSSGFAESARYRVLPADGVHAVALLTDGLETVAVDLAEGIPHEPFFRTLFELVRDPAESTESAEREIGDLLRSERICARTDDDKTLILAVRTGES